jgi:hypothetical protein
LLQRTRKDRLSPERVAQLNELRFVWNTLDLAWETMFAELQLYKEQFGDCKIPQSWAENPGLGRWVNTQRQRRRKGALSAEREARLDSLGLVWEVKKVVRRT